MIGYVRTILDNSPRGNKFNMMLKWIIFTLILLKSPTKTENLGFDNDNWNVTLMQNSHTTTEMPTIVIYRKSNQKYNKECKLTRSGLYYRGNISTTFTGQQCAAWSSMTSFNGTNHWSEFQKDSNFCRNPTNDSFGPYCYQSPHTDGPLKKQFCAIPLCGISTKLNEMYMKAPFDAFTKTQLWDLHVRIILIFNPLYVVIGTILNVFSILVFTQPSMKGSTTSLIFIVLAIVDILHLAVAIPPWLKLTLGSHLHVKNNMNCCIYNYINFTIFILTNWVLAAVTMERLTAVTKPCHAKLIWTKKNTAVALFCLLVTHGLINIPFLFCFVAKNRFVFEKDDVNFVIYRGCFVCCMCIKTFVRFILVTSSLFFPFLIILVGNISISSHILLANKKRQTIGNVQANQTKPQSITLQLLAISFGYLFCSLPYIVCSVAMPLLVGHFSSMGAFMSAYNLFFTLSMCFLYMKNSQNFLLYCMTGTRFRKVFYRMIRCGSLLDDNFVSTSSGRIRNGHVDENSQQ